MLQQTQVPRVERKWPDFMSAFPDVRALAAAPLSEVLKVWRGMGYDRRAVHLKRMAETVVAEHGGELPRTLEGLLALPGVGPATAGAVAAFAYGEPHPYVETNIRAVYLHRFFGDRCDVPDRELMSLVEATLDRDDPREWYYALMDYGAHLKRTTPNPCRRSAHHAPQAPLAGSRRQARARLLRAVLDEPGGTTERYAALAGVAAGDAEELLGRLRDEGFLAAEDGRWAVA
ncbi:MAG: A/G-specific adenine glycosylase [Coriobacteriia bacterium]|nr:A/G-specific adenine glycosylase [Coriobacteriia bacterium]